MCFSVLTFTRELSNRRERKFSLVCTQIELYISYEHLSIQIVLFRWSKWKTWIYGVVYKTMHFWVYKVAQTESVRAAKQPIVKIGTVARNTVMFLQAKTIFQEGRRGESWQGIAHAPLSSCTATHDTHSMEQTSKGRWGINVIFKLSKKQANPRFRRHGSTSVL